MKFLILLIALFSQNLYANICFELPPIESPEFSFRDNIKIATDDGIEIAANIFIPKNIEGKIPTVIFVNSWTLEEHEYFKQAKLLAQAGYQVLSYSTRGWGCSGGKINVIGDRDIKDLALVIDWLEENTQVDVQNIGMSGISYGGGMSLMAIAREPRVKTVVAMSAWADLRQAIYDQNSPRQIWGSVLIGTGALLGEIPTDILGLFKSLITHTDIGPAMDWAWERSPIRYIEEANRQNKPLFISNNFGDNLFQPNNVLTYFNQYTGPKVLDLNQGTHASAEITGLLTASNYTFKRMRQWFDLWLKGDQSVEFNLNEITLQTDLKHKRESIRAEQISSLKKTTFNLHSRNLFFNGKLKEEFDSTETEDFLYSGRDTRASTGYPILSAIIDGHLRVPVYSSLPWVQRLNGIYYKSSKFEKTLRLRGIPKLTLTTSSQGKHYQLVAYLYHVNPLGVAKLITHGVATRTHNTGALEKFHMNLVATAYDIPKGHKLALALDTEDLLYARPFHAVPFKTTIHFGREKVNQLVLPIKD